MREGAIYSRFETAGLKKNRFGERKKMNLFPSGTRVRPGGGI